MPLYPRSERFRGTLFHAENADDPVRVPRVLRGADALRATPPVEAPVLVPRVLRGADAQHNVRPFEVETMAPSPLFLLDGEADASEETPLPFEAEPPPPPDNASATEEAIRAEEATLWQARIEEAATRARENGYRQGHADAEKAAADELGALRTTVNSEVGKLQKAWEAHLRDNEGHMANLAFEVAEAILAAPLPEKVRRVTARALHEAIEGLKGSAFTLTLHPVDLLHLQEIGADEELRRAGTDLRFEADPFLPEGDWYLETEAGAVRHVRTELLDALRRRLGLLALGKG